MQRFRQSPLIAVIRGSSARAALEVSQALIEGGIRGIEVTFTTPDALWTLEQLSHQYGGGIALGAGTLRTPQQARDAHLAGASFLVSPGSPPALVEAMRQTGCLTVAGALTPTEVMTALEAGAQVIKLFPASLGGIPYARALLAPFPGLPFIPTGGVTPDNGANWLALGALALGMGGALAPSHLESAAQRENLIQLARQVSQQFPPEAHP